MLNLEGKVAVVTGAGNGIGLAAVDAFRERGARVVGADLDVGALQGMPDVTPMVADVTSEADMQRVAETAAGLGAVEVVMANAGVAAGGRFELVPIEEWQRLLDINVLGVVRAIQPFLTHLREQKGGNIVITGSSAGLFAGLFKVAGAVAAWNDARLTRKTLSQLSDRELDDIGLTRGDIDRIDF